MSKVPFILDTDPGIDDAVAIMILGASNLIDIKAITVVAGNVGIEHTSTNALNIANKCNIDTRVAIGANKPLIVAQQKAEEVHGKNGLKGIVLKDSPKTFDEKPAWDIIYEEAIKSNGKLHLCAIGPLTNIAITLSKYPDLPKYVDKFTIMGGAATWGNHSEYGEFNIWGDPHAADIVFKSFDEIAMIDLDIIDKCYITDNELRNIKSIRNKINDFSDLLFDDFLNDPYIQQKSDIGVHKFCDAVAAAYVINPSIFKGNKYYVRIETMGAKTFGQTIVDFNDIYGCKKNTIVFSDVDRQEYLKILLDMMKYYKG